MKLIYSSLLMAAALFGTSCHCDHNLEPPLPFKLGWVVCTDGDVVSFCDFAESDKEAIAIVYHVNPDFESDIAGYAVYLDDTDPVAFADTLESQGTSTDIYKLDGNENTYAMYSADKVGSPLGNVVFDMWKYGQSAYVPSVAQLKQIHAQKEFLNPRIEAIGGDELPDAPDDCWYWSSTEVKGQDDAKSWLVSMQSGAIQETPKDQPHKARAVITLYR